MTDWLETTLQPSPRRDADRALTIGLVEDDPDHALLASEALEERGHRVLRFTSAAAALCAAAAARWDCVILDYRLPDMSGLEALEDFQQLPQPVPVVMVTASGNESIAVAALKSGASDYVVKTGNHALELARAAELAAARHRIAQMSALYQRELEKRANTDALTGLLNRHRLGDVLSAVANRARQRGEPYAVAMLDVDHFKRINDTRGHAIGDAVLAEVALRLTTVVREEDIVARYGGDEFVIVMPGATRGSHRGLIARIGEALAQSPFSTRLGLTLSVSLGMADSGAGGPEEVLKTADQAMYRSRRRARPKRRRRVKSPTPVVMPGLPLPDASNPPPFMA
jgi:two-component system, cell cycle response regulator